MIIEEEQYLSHYGILRKSGRYPWGSGGTQNARNRTFLGMVEDLQRQGLSESEICTGLGIGTTDSSGVFKPSTTQLRAAKVIAKNEQKQSQITMAQSLKDKGLSDVEGAKRMGLPGSSYRALLVPGAKDKSDILAKTSETLKRQVDTHKYIDIGSGVENHLGVSKEKLDVAVAMLKEQGYQVHAVNMQQAATGLDTRMKVLVPPKITQKEAWLNRNNIKQLEEVSYDGGRSFVKVHDPIAINPNRVVIKYKEAGGAEADGIIHVRPGIEDISLGNSRYSQVRIQVGEGHFLKGMAVYQDNLPVGTDLVFHTKKSSTGNKLDAMKPLSDINKDLPFESVVRQILADPGGPNERVTSAMNMIGTKPGSGAEGSWGTWKKSISAQVLSKQSPTLAKSQLNMTYERRKREFDEINALTNPTVKKLLLDKFADSSDSAAVHLRAAALPRTAWHVILPITSLSPSQIYAPQYDNGERLALIRYPHGGTFEIPELTVNNKNREARKLIGTDSKDAVGIHHSVASRLSGADFDGDTVLVIPNNKKLISISPALEGLKNFDPQSAYPAYPGMKPIGKRKQAEMGNVSNLITDMTLKGAPHEHIVRAIRHSMVVIDADNHKLNYRESAIRNGIAQLKTEYQGGPRAGASTLISLKKAEDRTILERKPRPYKLGGPVNLETGRKEYVETGRTTRNKEGVVVLKRQKVNLIELTDDAHTLSSGTTMEKLYADHSNKLKSLANQARLASINTPPLKRSASAAKAYEKEVASLNSKLALVKRNRPLERQAQVIANAQIKAKRDANPNLEGDTLKKIKFQAQTEARIRMGAEKQLIKFTPKEWDAIQAGAISDNKLGQMLAKADLDVVRKLATPRTQILMTPVMTDRARSMLNSGYTRAEVAKQLGVSLTTLDTAGDE